MSSELLLGASDEASCTAEAMIQQIPMTRNKHNSGLLISKGSADARLNAADVKMYRDALGWCLTL
ncbi:hypothetical protein JMJ78_0008159 [Colletotrichum scovillei]|nr:hypothetical protein JMJ78_0008159 [Colletotrichum scovillei]